MEEFNSEFRIRREEIIRTEEINYSRKILKEVVGLRQYLPKVVLLNPHELGDFEEGRCNLKYGIIVGYKRVLGLMRIILKPNNFMYLQAIGQGGS